MSQALSNKVYTDLGVIPVINAAGTKTTHGGTFLSDGVLNAMSQASRSFVSIEELNRKIGEYIAKITGAEAGMVTSGAASGMVLAAAACMTGLNKAASKLLPNTDHIIKKEVITQKIHVGDYTHIYSFSGARVIEVGNINSCISEEIEFAINEKTAAIAYLFGPRIIQTGLSLKEIVRIARSNGIPVIVDAAATIPPLVNLKKYIDDGADLVTISGGKFIRGPQSTGILFGRKKLIEAAMLNANPNYSIGRPHKVSKENMIGLYTALKELENLNLDSMFQVYTQSLQKVKKHLDSIKGIKTTITFDNINYNVPVLIIEMLPYYIGPTSQKILELLMSGTPRIFMQYFKGINHLVVNPISLQEDELLPLAIRLCEVLSS